MYSFSVLSFLVFGLNKEIYGYFSVHLRNRSEYEKEQNEKIHYTDFFKKIYSGNQFVSPFVKTDQHFL